LGLDGFVVGAHELGDGEWWLWVETAAEVVGCATCGTRAVGHGRRLVAVRDLPVAGRPVVLCWSKKLWRCPEPDCEVGTWTESHEGIRPRRCLTERARAEMCRRVGEDEDSVAEVARSFGVGWETAMAAVRDHGQPRVDDPARLEGVEALGLDEHRFLSATPTKSTTWVTGFCDLDEARLLDVAKGNTAATVGEWLGDRPPEWRRRIRVAALDPHQPYATGLRRHLPGAELVVDHFHAVRLGNRAIDQTRRRVQNQTLGHRGRKDDPLYRIRRLLLTGAERLTERGSERLLTGLAAGDPDGEVGAAYLAKELLRAVYAAGGLTEARAALAELNAWCQEAAVPELTTLASTIRRWETQVLAYHTTRRSNGPTEAVNLLIENVRRAGYGLRNFDNYRLRLLLRCGVKWHTPVTARIRGRQPRLVA